MIKKPNLMKVISSNLYVKSGVPDRFPKLAHFERSLSSAITFYCHYSLAG